MADIVGPMASGESSQHRPTVAFQAFDDPAFPTAGDPGAAGARAHRRQSEKFGVIRPARGPRPGGTWRLRSNPGSSSPVRRTDVEGLVRKYLRTARKLSEITLCQNPLNFSKLARSRPMIADSADRQTDVTGPHHRPQDTPGVEGVLSCSTRHPPPVRRLGCSSRYWRVDSRSGGGGNIKSCKTTWRRLCGIRGFVSTRNRRRRKAD